MNDAPSHLSSGRHRLKNACELYMSLGYLPGPDSGGVPIGLHCLICPLLQSADEIATALRPKREKKLT